MFCYAQFPSSHPSPLQTHLGTWVAAKFLPSQIAIVAVVLLLLLLPTCCCCSCWSGCCCSLTALKSARINIKLAAIKAEKVNTLQSPENVSVRYIYCTICHTSFARRHFAFGFYSRAAILFMRFMWLSLPARKKEREGWKIRNLQDKHQTRPDTFKGKKQNN